MKKTMKRFVLLLALAACADETPGIDAAEAKAPAPRATTTPSELPVGELAYGIYLNGAKVGWMESGLTDGPEVVQSIELRAKVPGMGQVSTIEVDEERRYDKRTKQLVALSFTQRAATGSVSIHGKRVGGELELEISAGGATQRQRMVVDETLDDALAAMNLARNKQAGATVKAKHFDPSLQKTLLVEHRATGKEDLVAGGIKTAAFRIESTYNELGVNETAWLDENGKVLESRVGGFFIARLEPPEVARRLDYSQDLLINSVVKPPRKIAGQDRLASLALTFEGFGQEPPPTSTRQKVETKGGKTMMSLSRDPALPNVELPKRDGLPPEIVAELAATPFIQSDDARVVAAAKQAVAGATAVPEVVERLSSFVYSHVRDEYVPAYSNALEALSSGRGDCTEHSILFVALARALGLPARVAVGIAYWPPGDGFGWHAWAEVWADGRWYAVDPTWNQPQADATHVKLASGGPAEQARIVMLLGQLKIVDMRE